MFREKIRINEINTSHELSGRMSNKKSDKICRIGSELNVDSKVEMKYAG